MPSPPSHVHRGDRPSLPGEVLVVWALLAVVTIEILATYTRTPAAELYYVSGSGFRLAVHQALLFVGFPVGLVAIAVAGLSVDRIPNRLAVLASAAVASLGAVAFFSNGGEEAEVDVRAVSMLALAGVAIALALGLTAAGHAGITRRRGAMPGDRTRLAVAVFVGLLGIPWLLADLGISTDQIPLLNHVFISEAVRPDPGRPKAFSAVHDGHHHGMDGVLLVWSALLLTRTLPTISGRRLRAAVGPYIALIMVFGLANALQDFWTEQLVKRGVVSWELPRFTKISADPKWFALLIIAAVVYVLTMRPGGPLARAHAPFRRSEPHGERDADLGTKVPHPGPSAQ